MVTNSGWRARFGDALMIANLCGEIVAKGAANCRGSQRAEILQQDQEVTLVTKTFSHTNKVDCAERSDS
jgi:hypothetical protein